MSEGERGNGVGIIRVFFLQNFLGAQRCHCSMEFFSIRVFALLSQNPTEVTVINWVIN